MPWLDGTLHETSVVPFDVADRGLLLGDGVFDTALVLGGRMVWRQAHVARLAAATRTLGFAVDAGDVEAAIDAILHQTSNGALRITVTRGVGARGLAPPDDPRPTLLAAMAPLRAENLFAPVRLHTTVIRRNDTSPTTRIKSLNYLDGVLAGGTARKAGFDDALFLNTRGRVACTSIGNVFALFGHRLVTPPVADGVVPGIVRGALLHGGARAGLEPIESSLSPEDLGEADALFVTNSLRLIATASVLDDRCFRPNEHEKKLVAHLADLVRDETDVDPTRVA